VVSAVGISVVSLSLVLSVLLFGTTRKLVLPIPRDSPI
jgi:hypothetical protein